MSWYQSEEAAQVRESVEREIVRRRERGELFEPLVAPKSSKKLVQTFWGRAWCRHLESYSDYEHRLPRGRSYLRQGNVYNLAIEAGLVTAVVAGAMIYEVQVRVAPLEAHDWEGLKETCAGRVASLLDLLEGRLDEGLMQAMCGSDAGLFPEPAGIRMSCNCPDWADMCKHIAAVLYGIGVKFDADPALFFRLRGVDPTELLASSAGEVLSAVPQIEPELDGVDLGALFGIDLATEGREGHAEGTGPSKLSDSE